MSDSLYSILMSMANNPATLRKATKRAQPKIKRDYDKNVRKKMVQYYLDSYPPESYKRLEPSPLFLAYKTRSVRINDGTAVDVWVTDTGIDIGSYYHSDSYYHQGGGSWYSLSQIHSFTGKEYRANMEYAHNQFGKNNGTVEGSWILSNFEKGIHPTTNGWPRKKGVRKMRYIEKKKGSPLDMAEKYADNYFNLSTSYQYILSELDKMWNEMF